MVFQFLAQSARSEEKKADPPTPELEIEAKIPDPKKDGIVLVEFKNRSQVPVRLWDMTYSWGWANLGIVLIKGGHRTYYRKTLNPIFTKNYPLSQQVEPGKSLVRLIDLKSTSWIASNQLVTDPATADSIVVTYTVEKSPESEESGVWTGIACGGK
ncbi:MAG: hypothetical protein CFE26_01645 [Verrucomicrobiales bacterium VVV1]|nr:MAG: hypothetical protein CFE26_01645 [Verrucomicrobiales bacterium VVV1]